MCRSYHKFLTNDVVMQCLLALGNSQSQTLHESQFSYIISMERLSLAGVQ